MNKADEKEEDISCKHLKLCIDVEILEILNEYSPNNTPKSKKQKLIKFGREMGEGGKFTITVGNLLPSFFPLIRTFLHGITKGSGRNQNIIDHQFPIAIYRRLNSFPMLTEQVC